MAGKREGSTPGKGAKTFGGLLFSAGAYNLIAISIAFRRVVIITRTLPRGGAVRAVAVIIHRLGRLGRDEVAYFVS